MGSSSFKPRRRRFKRIWDAEPLATPERCSTQMLLDELHRSRAFHHNLDKSIARHADHTYGEDEQWDRWIKGELKDHRELTAYVDKLKGFLATREHVPN